MDSRLRTQLEFYFSDANVRSSSHMQALLNGAPGATGWASLAHVAAFRRVATMVGGGSGGDGDGGHGAVRDALAASTELEVSADGEQIRRRRPLPVDDDSALRTVYAEVRSRDESERGAIELVFE